MIAAIIGISSAIIIILLFIVLKKIDKYLIYSLILSGIGFIYVGFTWSDIRFLAINVLQAVFFLFIAYFGIKKNIYILIAGYFLHGLWDLVYNNLTNSYLTPPSYDIFCSTLDFTVGLYLLFIRKRTAAVSTV